MKKSIQRLLLHLILSLTMIFAVVATALSQSVLKLSAWFTAQDVNTLLSNECGLDMLVTDGLARRLADRSDILADQHLAILKVGGSPKELLKLSTAAIKTYRDKLLAPLGIQFDAPDKVELYLFGENYAVVQNLNDEPVDVTPNSIIV